MYAVTFFVQFVTARIRSVTSTNYPQIKYIIKGGQKQVEGLVNLMGENEDKEIQAAINLALVQQRVKSLEQWKCGYEEAQNQRWDNFEKKMDKFVDNLTIQVNNFSSTNNKSKR